MKTMSSRRISTGTRQQIMEELKRNGGATVLELAKSSEVSPVTVRHHLSSLQANGLVDTKVKRRSVGRPHYVYYLTEAGEELFPRHYSILVKRLLDQVKASVPPGTLTHIFEEMAREIVIENTERLDGKTGEERIKVLAEIMESEGFMVNLERGEGELRFIEHNCPYRNLVNVHPEICRLDQTLISTIMEKPVKKTSCVMNGDNRCAYVVKTSNDAKLGSAN